MPGGKGGTDGANDTYREPRTIIVAERPDGRDAPVRKADGPEKGIEDYRPGRPFAIRFRNAADAPYERCAHRRRRYADDGGRGRSSSATYQIAMGESSNDGQRTMRRPTETVRLKKRNDAGTTRQFIVATRVQRTAYNQAIEWQVKAQQALSEEALRVDPRRREGRRETHVSRTVTGTCSTEDWYAQADATRGWRASPEAKRGDGRIPYKSTERAERHGRVRCQGMQRIDITDQGTFQIAGLGELHVVGGVRRRSGSSVREVSIQETNREAPNGPEGSNREREFVVLMTLNVEHSASAPRPALERPPQRTTVEHDGGAPDRSRDDG